MSKFSRGVISPNCSAAEKSARPSGSLSWRPSSTGEVSSVERKEKLWAGPCGSPARAWHGEGHAQRSIDGFDGPIEQTRVLYKHNCAENPPGAKVEPFAVASIEVGGVKPGQTLVAAVSGVGAARRGVSAQVLAGDDIVQLGPDKLTPASGDPLEAQP